jgi:hypothetical protein
MSLQPRLINIRLRPVIRPDGKLLPSPLKRILPAPYKTPLPSSFRICQESRNEVTPQYQLLDGTTFYAAEGTMVNLEIDIVYCPDELFDVEDQIMPKTMVGLITTSPIDPRCFD